MGRDTVENDLNIITDPKLQQMENQDVCLEITRSASAFPTLSLLTVAWL